LHRDSYGPPQERQHHAPARLELPQQRRRWLVGRRGHHDLVVRRVLCPTARPVADADLDVTVIEFLQTRFGLAGKFLDDFDAVHLTHKFCQQGGVVTQAGADLQHRVVRFERQQIGHQRGDEGLRDRLVEAERQRRVLVGDMRQRRGHEQMPRHFQHRRQHPFIERCLAKFVFMISL
jgi:hypothetical protein